MTNLKKMNYIIVINFLIGEIDLLKNCKIIIPLGKIAFDAALIFIK